MTKRITVKQKERGGERRSVVDSKIRERERVRERQKERERERVRGQKQEIKNLRVRDGAGGNERRRERC